MRSSHACVRAMLHFMPLQVFRSHSRESVHVRYAAATQLGCNAGNSIVFLLLLMKKSIFNVVTLGYKRSTTHIYEHNL
jgi:hypothetical protein